MGLIIKMDNGRFDVQPAFNASRGQPRALVPRGGIAYRYGAYTAWPASLTRLGSCTGGAHRCTHYRSHPLADASQSGLELSRQRRGLCVVAGDVDRAQCALALQYYGAVRPLRRVPQLGRKLFAE